MKPWSPAKRWFWSVAYSHLLIMICNLILTVKWVHNFTHTHKLPSVSPQSNICLVSPVFFRIILSTVGVGPARYGFPVTLFPVVNPETHTHTHKQCEWNLDDDNNNNTSWWWIWGRHCRPHHLALFKYRFVPEGHSSAVTAVPCVYRLFHKLLLSPGPLTRPRSAGCLQKVIRGFRLPQCPGCLSFIILPQSQVKACVPSEGKPPWEIWMLKLHSCHRVDGYLLSSVDGWQRRSGPKSSNLLSVSDTFIAVSTDRLRFKAFTHLHRILEGKPSSA